MLRAIPFVAAIALFAMPALAADHKVEIQGMGFEPNTIEVAVGDTITFTNTNRALHTATADNGSFDTGRVKYGQSATVTIKAAGTFPFKCAIHSSMLGTVIAK